jgi:hypothetical protein
MSWVGGDAGKDIREPGPWIDAIHFGHDDQTRHGSRPPRSEPLNNQEFRQERCLASPVRRHYWRNTRVRLPGTAGSSPIVSGCS